MSKDTQYKENPEVPNLQNPDGGGENVHPANTDSNNSVIQNPSRNSITQDGNPTKGNTAGGNLNETTQAPYNKPRSNPQNNKPASVDGNAKAGKGSDNSQDH